MLRCIGLNDDLSNPPIVEQEAGCPLQGPSRKERKKVSELLREAVVERNLNSMHHIQYEGENHLGTFCSRTRETMSQIKWRGKTTLGGKEVLDLNPA